jgi:hypothetical protein
MSMVDGSRTVFDAVRRRAAGDVRSLVASGVSPNAIEPTSGLTPLMLACGYAILRPYACSSKRAPW